MGLLEPMKPQVISAGPGPKCSSNKLHGIPPPSEYPISFYNSSLFYVLFNLLHSLPAVKDCFYIEARPAQTSYTVTVALIVLLDWTCVLRLSAGSLEPGLFLCIYRAQWHRQHSH